jgi:hypothetical protein
MFRMFLAFAMLYCMYYLAIRYYRRLTGRQRWSLVKMMGYSTLLAVLTIGTMVGIVLTF